MQNLPYLRQKLKPYVTALKNLVFIVAEFACQEVLPLLRQVFITLFALVFFLLGFAFYSLRVAVEFIDDVVFQEMYHRHENVARYLAVQPSAVPIADVHLDDISDVNSDNTEEEKVEEKTLTVVKGPKFVDLPYIPYNPSDYQTGEMIAAFRNMFVDDETFEYVMYFLASTFDLTPKPRRLLMVRNDGNSGYTTLFGHHAKALDLYSSVIPSGVLCKEDDTGFGSCIHFHNYTDKTFIRYSETNTDYEMSPEYINAIVGTGLLTSKNAEGVLNDYESSAQQLIELRGSQAHLQTRKVNTSKRQYIRYLRMKVEFADDYMEPDSRRKPDGRILRKPDEDLYTFLRSDASVQRYVGYMRHMCQKLYDDYAGDINTVPHYEIMKETLEFMQGN
mgnify:CR=1 FL=1